MKVDIGVLLLVFLFTEALSEYENEEKRGVTARVSLYRDEDSTKGVVTFYQESPDAPVFVRGVVENIGEPLNSLHGFHIHKNGDTGDNCKAAGGHFNPEGVTHGAPEDSVRHVGDLGNIQDVDGTATFCKIDNRISLFEGANSIIGRAVVVHQGEDDLGKGGDKGSLASGNAGPRIACGVIGIVDNNELEESIPQSMCR